MRAEFGRSAEARADFAAVLESATGPVRERALYGRAVCAAALGDLAGARADLANYLIEFPSGAHAEEARRAIDK